MEKNYVTREQSWTFYGGTIESNGRVLDAEGTMEISISASRSAKGVKINAPVTFVSRPSAQGVLHGKGQGVLISGESEMATYTAEGIGRITPSGV